MLHKYLRLLFFTYKIGDFKIEGINCLQKSCLYSLCYGIFFNHAPKSKFMTVHAIALCIGTCYVL